MHLKARTRHLPTLPDQQCEDTIVEAKDRKKKRSQHQGGVGRDGFRNLGRAIQYLRHYRRTVIIAYAALLIATATQLIVPQLVQNIIDHITGGVTANVILGLPPNNRSLRQLHRA